MISNNQLFPKKKSERFVMSIKILILNPKRKDLIEILGGLSAKPDIEMLILLSRD